MGKDHHKYFIPMRQEMEGEPPRSGSGLIVLFVHTFDKTMVALQLSPPHAKADQPVKDLILFVIARSSVPGPLPSDRSEGKGTCRSDQM